MWDGLKVKQNRCFWNVHSKILYFSFFLTLPRLVRPVPTVRDSSRRRHERLRSSDSLPRRMGTLPETGVFPALSEHHPQRLHRPLHRVPRRHAAPQLPRPRTRQPKRRMEEQQHPAGETRSERRVAAQQVLQIQARRSGSFLRQRLAARRWC